MGVLSSLLHPVLYAWQTKVLNKYVWFDLNSTSLPWWIPWQDFLLSSYLLTRLSSICLTPLPLPTLYIWYYSRFCLWHFWFFSHSNALFLGNEFHCHGLACHIYAVQSLVHISASPLQLVYIQQENLFFQIFLPPASYYGLQRPLSTHPGGKPLGQCHIFPFVYSHIQWTSSPINSTSLF